MAKKVLVLCATSIATSTAIVQKVKELCREKNITVSITQAKGGDHIPLGPKLGDGFDLIITTVTLPHGVQTPVINGVPLITGIGEEKALADILKHLHE